MKRFKLLITLLISVLIISGCASGGKDKPKKDKKILKEFFDLLNNKIIDI